MVVTAMLAWFNESVEELHRAVTSLRNIADRVVAVDGGWDLYPGAQTDSPHEQADAIEVAAAQVGISAEVYPGRRWGGQVEKRNYMLELATPGSDWVMPLDADWEVTGDREAIRSELEKSAADAITVPFFTPVNPEVDTGSITSWHEELADEVVRLPLVLRALEDMRLEEFHWFYSGVRDGQRVWMWGYDSRYPLAVTEPLQAPMLVNHHCFYRDQRTRDANRDYCNQRAEHVVAHGREP